ncbi:leucine-rich repeat protein [Sunxiuqinia sp. sy24]
MDKICPAAGYTPELLCPANGYIKDPDVFIPDEEVADAISNPPIPGTIKLAVLSDGDRHLYFRVLTSSGDYRVSIYDSTGTFIGSKDFSSGYYYSDFIPTTDSRFTYVISAVSGNIEFFRAYTKSSMDAEGASIIACLINVPTLTTCDQMFYNMGKLRYCEFLCDCDSVTTFYRAFYGAERLEKLVMPSSAANVTNISNLCYNTFSLREASLPVHMPLLNNASYCFYKSNVGGTIRFPGSLAELNNLSSAFYSAVNVKNIILPTSAPKLASLASFCRDCNNLQSVELPADAVLINSLSYSFSNCYKLRGEFVFPELVACTNIAYCFNECYEVTRIEFTGAMDNCTDIRRLAFACRKVTHIYLPTSLEKLISTSSTASAFDNCRELVYLKLPVSWNVGSPFNGGTYIIFNALKNCTKLAEITTVEHTNNSIMGTINYTSLLSLVRFDQPQFRSASGYVTLTPAGAGDDNDIRGKLAYFDIDWSYVDNKIDLQYNSLPSAEILRIASVLPNFGNNQNHKLLAICKNPGAEDLNVKFHSASGSLGGNYLTVPADFGNITGYSAQRIGITYGVDATFDAVTNTVVLVANHGFSAGKKIAITYATADIGVSYGVDYYVINPTDNTFQLSETPGGSAVSFSASAVGSIAMELTVVSMVGTTAYFDCNLQSGSHSTWLFSPSIDFFEANKKGWMIQ